MGFETITKQPTPAPEQPSEPVEMEVTPSKLVNTPQQPTADCTCPWHEPEPGCSVRISISSDCPIHEVMY